MCGAFSLQFWTSMLHVWLELNKKGDKLCQEKVRRSSLWGSTCHLCYLTLLQGSERKSCYIGEDQVCLSGSFLNWNLAEKNSPTFYYPHAGEVKKYPCSSHVLEWWLLMGVVKLFDSVAPVMIAAWLYTIAHPFTFCGYNILQKICWKHASLQLDSQPLWD